MPSRLRTGEGWVTNIDVSIDVWRSLISETLQGILAMLHGATQLMNAAGHNESDIHIAAGLYTYAVEEYGKLSYLLGLTPNDGRVRIRYKEFFRNHAMKFQTALSTLPRECLTLSEGAFSSAFDSSAFNTESGVSFEARLGIFYTDLTDAADAVTPLPRVDEGHLRAAIAQLESIAMSVDTSR